MKLNEKRSTFMVLAVLSILIPTSACFGINGAIFSKEVSPGQELVHEITVIGGDNDSTQNMVAGVYGFAMTENGSNIQLGPEEDIGPYTARPFLSVEPTSFELEPGERERLLLTGTVPEDVGPGGRYALVTIKTAPKESGSIMVSTAIQVLVLLTIKDSELIETGEITELELLEDDNGPVASLRFENTGNHHYKVSSEAVIKDESGEIVAEASIPLGISSILPANMRLLEIPFDQETDLAPGIYTVEATVIKEDGTVLDTEEATFEV